MPPFECALRVRYAETDQMGVVYHANLFAYFEVGRTELLRAVGPPYRDLEARGFLLAVVEAALEYRRPIRYDAPLKVRTRLTALGPASVAFAYEVVHAETGEIHARGSTRHACVSPEGRPLPLPGEVRDSLNVHLRP